ncbi:hypothetical protein AB5I41_03580 [Sphingomonas sp. MMS24-JH45]
MLDTFMLAFLIWGIVVLGWAMRRRVRGVDRGRGAAGAGDGVQMGVGALRGLRRGGVRHAEAGGCAALAGRRAVAGLALLGGVSVATYLATFLPYFFTARDAVTLKSLLPLQWEMYLRQKQLLPAHTYQSDWWSWPLMRRPIWYLYEPADGAQRGILLIGNPVVMWGGPVAAPALMGWVKTGSRPPGAGVAADAGGGAVRGHPQSLGFYYYYYPASVFLCVAIAVAFDHRRARPWDELFLFAAFAMALYFLPVLSAQALTDPATFRRWTWFASWV